MYTALRIRLAIAPPRRTRTPPDWPAPGRPANQRRALAAGPGIGTCRGRGLPVAADRGRTPFSAPIEIITTIIINTIIITIIIASCVFYLIGRCNFIVLGKKNCRKKNALEHYFLHIIQIII